MITSFDFNDMPIESESPIRLMLTNLGIQFDNSIYENKRAVDVNGNLIKFKEDANGISFWVFSPRSLIDLLAEPDMPKLSLEIREVADFNFVLNGDKDASLQEIPLDRGWNKFVIKFWGNIPENKQKIKASFKCDQPEFFKQINSITER